MTGSQCFRVTHAYKLLFIIFINSIDFYISAWWVYRNIVYFIAFINGCFIITCKWLCFWHHAADQVVPEKELKHKAPFSPANGNKELDKSTELSVDDSDSAEVDILDIIDREYMEVTSADIFHDFFTKYEDLFSWWTEHDRQT